MRLQLPVLCVSIATLASLLAMIVGIEFEGLALSVRNERNEGIEPAPQLASIVAPGRIEGLFTGDVPDEFLVDLYPVKETLGLASHFVPLDEAPIAITSARSGAFAFENLAPGGYGIRPDRNSNRLYAFAGMDECRWVEVNSGCTGRSFEKLRLTKGCLVRGTVEAVGRSPAANAHVFAIESTLADDLAWLTNLENLIGHRYRRNDTTWIETILRRAHHGRADSHGHYEIRALERGTYRVFAATEDGSISPKRSIQATPDSSAVDFVVEPGGFVRGVARSHSVLALRRAEEHDPREILESSDAGQFAFLPIPEGDAVIESLGDDMGLRRGPAFELARIHVARNSTATLDLRASGFPVTVTILSGGIPVTRGSALFRGMQMPPDDAGRITLYSESAGEQNLSFRFVLDDVAHTLCPEVAVVPGTSCATTIDIGSCSLAIAAIESNGSIAKATLTDLHREYFAQKTAGASGRHGIECRKHVIDRDTSQRIHGLPIGRYSATVQFENGAIGQAAILLEHDDVLYVREGQHAPRDF